MTTTIMMIKEENGVSGRVTRLYLEGLKSRESSARGDDAYLGKNLMPLAFGVSRSVFSVSSARTRERLWNLDVDLCRTPSGIARVCDTRAPGLCRPGWKNSRIWGKLYVPRTTYSNKGFN